MEHDAYTHWLGILERERYDDSDFARLLEREAFLPCSATEEIYYHEQAQPSSVEAHRPVGPQWNVVPVSVMSNVIVGDNGPSHSSSLPVRNVTPVTQERYIPKKGRNRFSLPENPYSISFRAPGKTRDGVIANARCDASKIEGAEELVFAMYHSQTITIHLLPSADFKSQGWSDWDGTINIKNGKTEDNKYIPITRQRLFELISGRFKGCIEGRRSSRITKTPLINPFPAEVTLNRIEIRKLYQVSLGSFQVDLGILE